MHRGREIRFRAFWLLAHGSFVSSECRLGDATVARTGCWGLLFFVAFAIASLASGVHYAIATDETAVTGMHFSSLASSVSLLVCVSCVSADALEKCESDLSGSVRQSVPGGAFDLFRSLLSATDFSRLHRLGVIEHGFVVRLAELSEIQNLSLWSERQSNAYLVWSRRLNEEWTPIRNARGDRRVFRSSRSSQTIRQRFLDQPPALVADELLFLPLRPISTSKSKKPSLQGNPDWRFFGCAHSQEKCRYFDGSGADRFVHDLKRHRAITEAKGGFSFYMKTRSYNGVIFSSYGSQGDFLLVQLRSGRLIVVIDFGGSQPRHLSASISVNDGLWHGISIEYIYDDCSLYVDGVLVASTTKPLSGYRLDLDRDVLLGGAPYSEPFLKFMVAENFTGCLDSVVWNDRSSQSRLRSDRLIGSVSGNAHKCHSESAPLAGVLIAFAGGSAWIEKRGRPPKRSPVTKDVETLSALRLGVRFRTVSERGHIWRSIEKEPISDSLSSFNVSVVDGVLSCQLLLDGDPFALKSRRRVDDGLWHRLDLKLQSRLVELVVDDQPTVRLEAKFNLLAPPDELYVLGGGGFVGCIETLTVNGREENLRQYEKQGTEAGADGAGIIWDRCPMWDRCHPNPCANGGTCNRSPMWNGYTCACPEGYSGRHCSNVDLPHSCQEYQEFFHNRLHSGASTIKIDLDDSGPLNALEVECRPDGSTILRHDQTEAVDIYGYLDRGGAKIDFAYDGIDRKNSMDTLAVAALTRRAEECSQEMSYKCFGGASLMGKNDRADGERDRNPSTWWLSWTATNVHAWGSGELDSMMCSCAVSGTCSGAGNCNCDSVGTSTNEDVGNVTRKELLPVRGVFVGDTDYEQKRASVRVGPLICTGDESFRPATFLERIAYVEVPFESSGDDASSLSGHLQFRTRECLISLLSTVRRLETEEDDDGCEYLRLHIENCRTAVLTVCGGGGVTKAIANFSRAVNDDNWHAVRFAITTTTVTILLNNEDAGKASIDHLYTIPDTSGLLAWRLGSAGEYGSGFTGAVRSIFLNGRWIPISNLDGVGRVQGIVKTGLVNRCASVDENGIEDGDGWCLNGGRCEEHYNRVICDCSGTPFSGSRCQQDISYDLVGALAFSSDPSKLSTTTAVYGIESNVTMVDYLRLGFQTKSVRSALLRGFDRRLKADVLALLLTDTGTLRLLYTDNYTPFTVEEDGRNFADGYFHDVMIKIDSDNRSITMEVDRSRSRKLEFHFPSNVRPVLNRLDWIVGDDGLTTVFSGCLSRLQIGQNFFPFKTFGAMLRAAGDSSGTPYRVSMCPAIEDNLPEIDANFSSNGPPRSSGISVAQLDASSNLFDAPRVRIRPVKQPADRSLIVGATAAAAMCFLLLILCCLIRFCRSRPAGEYKTHEETLYLSGPVSGRDSSRQALVGGEVSPSPVERREWFI